MTFPLQILSLNLDSTDNILGIEDTLSLNIDESNIPFDINFDIYDSFAGIEYDFDELQEFQ